MKKKRIAIIGHFGGKEIFLDGQTIKTKIIHDELESNTDWEIIKIDTYYSRKNKLKLLLHSIWSLLRVKDVQISISGNGMRIYFPMLYFFAKVFGVRVYHNLLGANLDRYIEKYPAYVKYLNSFTVNWVEMDSLKRRLENKGLTNVEVMPNFKRLDVVQPERWSVNSQMPFKLCTFSRVMKEKGIEDAIAAVKAVNEKLGKTAYILNIYGQVDAAQTEWFDKVQENLPEYVYYHGLIHYSKSVETLKDHFALLFPTRFFTEGVPGTIVDAYAAGLPVIASRWEGFDDVIEQGVSGFGYEFENVDALVQLLIRFAEHPEQILKLKRNCIEKARYYLPETSVKVMINRIELEERR